MRLNQIFDRDTVLHLRIPFSFFLLPVFMFGISQSLNFHATNAFILFIALHLFIYPGSNIYNSYMDKDTGSIGGLEHPPPVTRKMYYASIFADVTGVAICLCGDWKIAMVMLGYIAFSKSYSWYGIRLKKYALWSWLSVMFFQGAYTYMLSNMGADGNVDISWFTLRNIEAMFIASCMLGGSYPLTQVYQHSEDGERGDRTLSYRLGIRGTFIFSAAFFSLGAGIAVHYFLTYATGSHLLLFASALLVTGTYFTYWMFLCFKDRKNADYKHTMLMNKISSAAMVICFGILSFVNLRH